MYQLYNGEWNGETSSHITKAILIAFGLPNLVNHGRADYLCFMKPSRYNFS